MPRYPWYLRFAWILALVGGILAYIVTFIAMLITQNSTMLPTVLLVGAATVPVTVLLFAQSSRAGALAPTGLVLATLAIGGLTGITIAGFTESIAGAILGKESILLVGIIEETAKLVVPALVLLVAHKATRGGGIVIGIAAATGFAILETMGYGFNALLEKNGGLAALDSTLILRGILVPAGHVAWTGSIAAALWHLVESPKKLRAAVALVVAYVAAIVLHTAWDATTSGVLHVLIGLVSVAALLWLTIGAHRAFTRRAQAAGTLAGAPAASATPVPAGPAYAAGYVQPGQASAPGYPQPGPASAPNSAQPGTPQAPPAAPQADPYVPPVQSAAPPTPPSTPAPPASGPTHRASEPPAAPPQA